MENIAHIEIHIKTQDSSVFFLLRFEGDVSACQTVSGWSLNHLDRVSAAPCDRLVFCFLFELWLCPVHITLLTQAELNLVQISFANIKHHLLVSLGASSRLFLDLQAPLGSWNESCVSH